MSEHHPTVVCADPDDAERAATVEALTAADLDVVGAATVAAVDAAVDESVDCVVTAFSFPDGDAFDVVDAVRLAHNDCVCILFTDESPSDLPRGRPDQVVEYVPRSIPAARERLADVVALAAAESTHAAFPVPDREKERLAAVRGYDVEALAAEETFERLTALMTTHFDIDVAFVGLVDEHEERFVACEGANWRTLAREDSICTHTILSDELTVVEDTHEDPRFAANERLDDLDIRSYAGARITDGAGNALGAVCCIDDEPRSYTAAERADLRRFADEVEEQLSLRRRLGAGVT
ncbi:GAF domain-containing protein [Halomicroarcula sp. GCM10025817]|uniref:GAF domain-containing protein n=1 Tax=Haloarcula TaxID=2237 RepID=UPI0023E8D2D2|nr:GAF domain-containing protein [Halomicroarcula sp. SYNS111]